MLDINMADVMNIVNLCVPYLIGFAVVLIEAIAAMIVCRKNLIPRALRRCRQCVRRQRISCTRW